MNQPVQLTNCGWNERIVNWFPYRYDDRFSYDNLDTRRLCSLNLDYDQICVGWFWYLMCLLKSCIQLDSIISFPIILTVGYTITLLKLIDTMWHKQKDTKTHKSQLTIQGQWSEVGEQRRTFFGIDRHVQLISLSTSVVHFLDDNTIVSFEVIVLWTLVRTFVWEMEHCLKIVSNQKSWTKF